MGKDIHPSILEFFHKTVGNHQCVERIEEISNSEHFIFKIIRKNGKSDVNILLSDAYYYGHVDFYTRPEELLNGGIILVAKPESQFTNDEHINEEDDRIIIGKIGIVLGALNYDEYWKYEKPKKKTE